MNRPDPEAIARLLRQRQEMGLPGLVLDDDRRDAFLKQVEALAREARTGGAGGGLAGDSPAAAGDSTAAPMAPPARGPAAATSATAGRGRAAASQGSSSSDGPPPAPSAPAELPVLDLSGTSYDELRELALGCTRCGLSQSRTQVVFSDGNPAARLVVVGEAPGANEDRTGLPFVGAAGKLLDLMLASVDLSREESVYIANVLKCRPPGNRNPEKPEIAACSPFLRRQLELIEPQALLAVGTFAAQLLTGSDKALGKLRGEVHSYQGIPLVVTYHPAALLRNGTWTRATWDDLQLLRQVMD